MAYFLCSEGSGVTVTVDGVEVEDLSLISGGAVDVSVSTLPYEFKMGSVVIYDGELHILGSVSSGCQTAHYKYNGTSWIRESTLPYEFYYGGAVVHKNIINILGGTGTYKYHYAIQKPIYIKGGAA